MSVPRLVVLTDRRQLPPGVDLVDHVARCAPAGLTHVLLRELDLPDVDRAALVVRLRELGLRVWSAHRPLPGVEGVHLPGEWWLRRARNEPVSTTLNRRWLRRARNEPVSKPWWGGGFETVAAQPPQPPGDWWLRRARNEPVSKPWWGGGFETVAAQPPQPPGDVAAQPPQPPGDWWLRRARNEPVSKPLPWGRSCHTGSEVARAAEAGASWVTLSPVAPSASKPGRMPIGWESLAGNEIPVLALGGVDAANARALREAGAHGVAVMGAVMRSDDPAEIISSLLEATR